MKWAIFAIGVLAFGAFLMFGGPGFTPLVGPSARAVKHDLPAGTVQWTDADGGLHLTDDMSSVPAEARATAEPVEPKPAPGELSLKDRLRLAAIPAGAMVRWTDAAGETHYTDDLTSVPDDRKATVERVEGGELSVVKPDHKPELPRVSTATEPERSPFAESQWRRDFQQLAERVTRAAHAVAAAKQAVEDAERDGAYIDRTGVPVSKQQRIADAKRRQGEAELELELAKSAQHELERKAALEAVPLEWRR